MIYDEIAIIKGDIEAHTRALEKIMISGPNDRVNSHLLSAVQELRMALADLSLAEYSVINTGAFSDEDFYII